MIMFASLRSTVTRASAARSFSTTLTRRTDLSKLTLIGHLVRVPEARTTKNDKEYVLYTVATQNYPPPPPDANGDRKMPTSTFHRVLSFQEGANKYLKNMKKGSKVYVEAAFELREPEVGADPTTPQGQRQIFLRHETIRTLSAPRSSFHESEEDE